MKTRNPLWSVISIVSCSLLVCGTAFASDYAEDTVSWNKLLPLDSSHGAYNSIAIDTDGNVYVAGAALDLVDSGSGWDWILKSSRKTA